MDTLILAAGENVRLQAAGLAPGMKPLIIVDGEVLIRRLCRQARVTMGPKDRLIIIGNPSNVRDLAYASAGYDPLFVMQMDATGPCDAVQLGIKHAHTRYIRVLMGDNYIAHMPELDPSHNTICVTRSQDEALHHVDRGFLVRGEPADHRWLGPIVFAQDDWCLGNDWVDALGHVAFKMLENVFVQDMGVLK